MPVLDKHGLYHLKTRALSKLDPESYPGAVELVLTVIDESKAVDSWRPLRAAAAALEPGEAPIWMTAEQFTRWYLGEMALERKLKTGRKPSDVLGIQATARASYLNGSRAIPKIIALACAHISASLPLPIEAGDSAKFSFWFTPRFGSPTAINDFLDLGKEHISNRVRGYRVVDDERRPRLPEEALIRALDWVYRFGPCCPFGDRPPPAVFPGQSLEVSDGN
jgi:hypothetical protein